MSKANWNFLQAREMDYSSPIACARMRSAAFERSWPAVGLGTG